MTCFICSQLIGTTQLRHSDGTGDYHVICEFNQIRQQLGMPSFESLRRVKYYADNYVPVSRGRVHLSLRNEVTQVNAK